MIFLRNISTLAAAIAVSAFVPSLQANEADDQIIDIITVTADFRKTDVQIIPEATTVVGGADIEARSAEHLEQVLSFAPNVNFSSGASRGRFYQIRGIGERSQFVDPVNPSVGLIIDGIDMTGLGGAATLFDVEQVEVLRGPQGTRFGANALAGVINIRSNAPTEQTEGYVSARAGNYDSYGLGAAVSGSISDKVQGRIAVQGFQSDGYIDNTFLNRDDTNNVDEIIARGKLAYQLDEQTDVGLTYLYADIDNGYDAFSLDNSRTTFSDQPGIDAQDTNALALNIDHDFNDAVTLQSVITGSWSDVVYSYDEDWSYVGIAPALEYSSFDEYLRNYQRQSIDLRLLSGENGRIFNGQSDWVLGLYVMQRNEDLTRNYTYDSQFNSDLNTASIATYGELSTDLNSTLRLISGVRIERWTNDYDDNNGLDEATGETMLGGKITLEALLNNYHMTYVSVARGYKAGGINTDPDISEDNRIFDAEYNNTLEVGLKSSLLDDGLTTRVAAFYIQRKDQQVKSSYAVLDDTGKPISFQDYLANAAEGRNYGLELESNWQLNHWLNWELSYGYLITEFVDYNYTNDDGEFNKDGRAQAHAPQYSAATALTFDLTDALSIRLESEAKDQFYFSDSHDEKSKAYVLWNARVAYDQPTYSVALYGRNLTDQDVEVRGFGGFGNDPRNGYETNRYVQYGEPLTYGLEGKLYF
ncbi:MAG: TonB-dependent receptor [Oleibacter sp.]|nr:TonB-dependent receptor [Thalassolituus sp.]